MDEFEALALAIEETLEVGVGVGVDIVFFKDCEAAVLDDGVFERADLELMRAL